jgi:hypothetical protein
MTKQPDTPIRILENLVSSSDGQYERAQCKQAVAALDRYYYSQALACVGEDEEEYDTSGCGDPDHCDNAPYLDAIERNELRQEIREALAIQFNQKE